MTWEVFLITIKKFILAAIHGIIPILLGIFILVLIAIIAIRIILTILLNKAQKRLAKLKKLVNKLPTKSKKYLKEEEELRRYKDTLPRAHSEVKAEMRAKASKDAAAGGYEIIPSEDQERGKSDLDQITIVDIVKPIGFWTSVILGQKLTFLIQSAQIINKRGDKGFWASMIEAKEREAGKQHARGR